MDSKSRFSCALGIVVIVCSTALVAEPAGAATSNQQLDAAFTGVPVSTGIPLFSGTAVDGSTPAVGAVIILSGLPTTTEAAPNPGVPVPLAQTTASGSGAWGISVPSGTNLIPYEDGTSVNFQITQYDAAGSDTYDVSATVPSSTSTSPSASDGSSSVALDASNTGPVTLNSTVIPAVTTATSAVSPDDQPTQETCSNSNVTDYSNTRVEIASSYSQGSGAYFQLTYTKSASSELGGGISTTGAVGSFSADGTVSKSSTGTQTYAAVNNVANVTYYTYFTYQKFKSTCVVRTPQSTTTYINWYLLPDYWDGGGATHAVPSIAAGDCVPEHKGYGFSATMTTASTFTAGVSLPDLNLTLESTTGYTSEVGFDIEFPTTGHPLCGLNGPPGTHPGLFQIHATVI